MKTVTIAIMKIARHHFEADTAGRDSFPLQTSRPIGYLTGHCSVYKDLCELAPEILLDESTDFVAIADAIAIRYRELLEDRMASL